MYVDQERFFNSAFDEIRELMREELIKEALSVAPAGKAAGKAVSWAKNLFSRGGAQVTRAPRAGAVPPPLPAGMKPAAGGAGAVVPPAPPPPVPAGGAPLGSVNPLARGPKGQLTGPAAPSPTVPTAAHPGAAAAAKPPPVPAPAAAPAAAGAAAAPVGAAAAPQLSQSSLAKGVRGWRAMGLGGGMEHMGRLYQAGGVRGVLGSHMGRVAAGGAAGAVAVPTAMAYGAGRVQGARRY